MNEHGFPIACEELHKTRQQAPSSSFVSPNSPLVPHHRDPKSHPEEKVLLNELGFPLTYEELHSSRRLAPSSALVSSNPPLFPDNRHPRKHPEGEYPLNAHGIPLTYEAPRLPPRPVVLPLQQPQLSHQSQEHTPRVPMIVATGRQLKTRPRPRAEDFFWLGMRPCRCGIQTIVVQGRGVVVCWAVWWGEAEVFRCSIVMIPWAKSAARQTQSSSNHYECLCFIHSYSVIASDMRDGMTGIEG